MPFRIREKVCGTVLIGIRVSRLTFFCQPVGVIRLVSPPTPIPLVSEVVDADPKPLIS